MISFAIIGLGKIGIRHAHHISSHSEARLAGGYDIKPERVASFNSQYACKHYESEKDLLSDTTIDVV